MIYIMATVFIIVCVASVCYNKGARTQQHHDGCHGSYYKNSHQKQWQEREMDK